VSALLAGAAALAAALLATGRGGPPARPAGPDATRPRRRPPGAVLEGIGRVARRALGGRPDHRLDRRAGSAVAVLGTAALLGPAPAILGAGAVLAATRWRRLRAASVTRPVDVQRDLPDLVDLLTLAVGAGLSVPAALPAITPMAPAALRPGLRTAVDRLGGGQASDDAVGALGEAWGDPARSLVHALTDHLRYGTPALPALERVAVDARTTRRRAAESRSRRLPVLLLFPLVLCTLPAFGLLTVAPLVAGTFDSLRGGHLEAPASVAP
jgi:tight adherence protein C